jgi:hydroxymethylpyrimidine/phosphomethylpyrimidine kinase
VASTGDRLLTPGAERAYVDELLPLARVTTPNLREAGVLIGATLERAADVVQHADELAALCPGGWVVVTGGHVSDDEAIDVVLHGDERHELPGPWIATENDHGTGCTFASSIAARLALGDEPLVAIREAKDFVAAQIRRSAGWHVGHGRGPVAHTLRDVD